MKHLNSCFNLHNIKVTQQNTSDFTLNDRNSWVTGWSKKEVATVHTVVQDSLIDRKASSHLVPVMDDQSRYLFHVLSHFIWFNIKFNN